MINFAIVGTGIMAEIYATIISQRTDTGLKFVAGNTAEKTKSFAERFSCPHYSTNGNLEPLIKSKEVDAAIIASPEWAREIELPYLVNSKLHLLIEKPFMTKIDKSKHFIEELRKKNEVVEYCTVLRFSPKFDACKKAIENGDIGEIRHIHARRDSNNERVKRVLGKTDLAFWLAPHDLDMIYYLTGSEIKFINSISLNGARSADDFIISNIKLQNNVCAVLQNSWCTAKVSNLTQNAIFEVYGTKGKIEIKDSEMDVKVFNESQTEQPDTYEFSNVNGFNYGIFYNLVDHFVKRIIKSDIKGNKKVLDSIEANMQMCDLLSRSLK